MLVQRAGRTSISQQGQFIVAGRGICVAIINLLKRQNAQNLDNR